MSHPKTKERRVSVRAKRVLSIEYRLKKSNRKLADTKWHLSTTHDMSVAGITFYADNEYKVGDLLEINVKMSGLIDIYSGIAKIVRIDKKKSAAHYLVAVSLQGKNPKIRSAKRHVIL